MRVTFVPVGECSARQTDISRPFAIRSEVSVKSAQDRPAEPKGLPDTADGQAPISGTGNPWLHVETYIEYTSHETERDQQAIFFT